MIICEMNDFVKGIGRRTYIQTRQTWQIGGSPDITHISYKIYNVVSNYQKLCKCPRHLLSYSKYIASAILINLI